MKTEQTNDTHVLIEAAKAALAQMELALAAEHATGRKSGVTYPVCERLRKAIYPAPAPVKPAPAKALYSFRFVPTGINAVWAHNETEALAVAQAEFPTWASKIDPKSFVRRETKADQDAYWNGLPLMD